MNISLIDLPIRLLLRWLPRRRLQTFLRQLIKLAILVPMFLRARGLAMAVGLHSRCVSWAQSAI